MKIPFLRLARLSLLTLAILPHLLLAADATPVTDAAQRWAKYEPEFQVFAAKDLAQPPAKGGILFVGSSIFRQWTTVGEQMAPLPVLNRAFGGSRTGDQLARFDQVVGPYAPKVIVYYCGSNDINAESLPPEIGANFQAFVGKVRAALPATRILFVSILRAPQKIDHWDRVDAANQLIRDFCAHDPLLAYVDVNPAVFTAEGKPRMELYKEDKLHYLAPAYVGFTAIIKPVLARIWAAAKTPAGEL